MKGLFYMSTTHFWNADTNEYKTGYTLHENTYACLFCGKQYEQGIIYPVADQLLEAKKAIEVHIQAEHGELFYHYLKMGRIYTNLSAGQEEVAMLSYEGLSDNEIMKRVGAASVSTVRNTRFAIREKYKQAKILVALFELMEENKKHRKHSTAQGADFIEIHATATMVDERYAITQAERDEVLKRYFTPEGTLRIATFPAKEKKKIIVLQKLMEHFDAGVQYTEAEINERITPFYGDFAIIRRYLVDYGFLERDKEEKAIV